MAARIKVVVILVAAILVARQAQASAGRVLDSKSISEMPAQASIAAKGLNNLVFNVPEAQRSLLKVTDANLSITRAKVGILT